MLSALCYSTHVDCDRSASYQRRTSDLPVYGSGDAESSMGGTHPVVRTAFTRLGHDVIKADNDKSGSLSHHDQSHVDLWSCVFDTELASPDVFLNDLIRVDDDAGIAERSPSTR